MKLFIKEPREKPKATGHFSPLAFDILLNKNQHCQGAIKELNSDKILQRCKK